MKCTSVCAPVRARCVRFRTCRRIFAHVCDCMFHPKHTNSLHRLYKPKRLTCALRVLQAHALKTASRIPHANSFVRSATHWIAYHVLASTAALGAARAPGTYVRSSTGTRRYAGPRRGAPAAGARTCTRGGDARASSTQMGSPWPCPPSPCR